MQEQFQFHQVAFFGRGIDEYVLMFDLRMDDLLGKSILDCSAGPASFACEATARGVEVTAVDPMYEMPAEKLRELADADSQSVTLKQKHNRDLIYDDVVPTHVRRTSMEVFLRDFTDGKTKGRYVAARLPRLPFADGSFDLVLCGNFLFEYSDTQSGGMLAGSPFDFEFHIESVEELMRVCRSEARIYPLLAPGVREHKYLAPLMDEFAGRGFSVELVEVKARDIIGAETMLRISHDL